MDKQEYFKKKYYKYKAKYMCLMAGGNPTRTPQRNIRRDAPGSIPLTTRRQARRRRSGQAIIDFEESIVHDEISNNGKCSGWHHSPGTLFHSIIELDGVEVKGLMNDYLRTYASDWRICWETTENDIIIGFYYQENRDNEDFACDRYSENRQFHITFHPNPSESDPDSQTHMKMDKGDYRNQTIGFAYRICNDDGTLKPEVGFRTWAFNNEVLHPYIIQLAYPILLILFDLLLNKSQWRSISARRQLSFE